MATPSHVDLSVLWVPIMPETSKLGPAMEDAGKDATESFGKGTSGLGDRIHDSFTKATGKVKDVFHKAGNDASESMADGVKEKSSKVEEALEDSGKKASGRFKSTFDGLADRLGTELGAKIGGNLSEQLQKVDDYAKNVGIDISGWTGPAKDAVGNFSTLKDEAKGIEGQIKDVTSQLTGMPGLAGKFGTAIGEVAGPISLVVGLSQELFREWNNEIDSLAAKFHDPKQRAGLEAQEAKDHPFTPAAPDKPLSPMDMTTKTAEAQLAASGDKEALRDLQLRAAQGDQEAATLLRDNNLSTAIPADPTAPPMAGGSWWGGPGRGHGPIPPAPTPAEHPAAPSSSATPSAMPSFTDSISSSASSPAELHASGGRISNLWKVAQALQGTPYSQQLRNDCSGMVSKLATAALGMAPSVQFSTVNEGDWLFSHGFQPGLGGPGDLNIGWWDQGGGNNGHTAATLPGGVNAESGGGHGFQLGGSVGASSSQFTQHAHLAMDGAAPGGLGDLGAGMGGGPAGTPSNPIFVALAGGGMGGSGGGAGGGGSLGMGGGGGGGPALPDFLGGALQLGGLDGSVFHSFGGSSNPMGFGITKLGTGLLNMFGGMLGGGGAGTAGTHPLDHGAAGSPLAALEAAHMALPGMAPASPGSRNQPSGQLMGGSGGGGGMGANMGGKGGGINAAISGGIGLATAAFSDLSPGVGAPDSANGQYHLLPNPTVSHPNPGGGAAGQGESVTHQHFYGDTGPQVNVTQIGVKSPTEDFHAAANGASNRLASMGGVSNSGSLPSST